MSPKRLISLILSLSLLLSILTACGNFWEDNTGNDSDIPSEVSAGETGADAAGTKPPLVGADPEHYELA